MELLQCLSDSSFLTGDDEDDIVDGVHMIRFAMSKKRGFSYLLKLRDEQAECVLFYIQKVRNQTISQYQRQRVHSFTFCCSCQWLDAHPLHLLRQRAISLLVKLSAESQQFPPCLFLREVDLGPVRDPDKMGGFADVFRGSFQGGKVAVKRLRISTDFDRLSFYPVRRGSSLSKISP
jgi:hypothetical protein